MSNSIAPGSSADVNVRVTALTTNPNVPAQYKTIILKKNLVNGVNTLTQAMMNQTNTKYVIKYDYTLGENIDVPSGCIIEFDGGSISGSYILTGVNTAIKADLVKIFSTNITIAGTWKVSEIYTEWFGAIGDGVTDDTVTIQSAINQAYNISVSCVKFLNKNYLITSTIYIKPNLIIEGSHNDDYYEPMKNILVRLQNPFSFAFDSYCLDSNGNQLDINADGSEFADVDNLPKFNIRNISLKAVSPALAAIRFLSCLGGHNQGIKTKGFYIGFIVTRCWGSTFESISVSNSYFGIISKEESNINTYNNVNICGSGANSYIDYSDSRFRAFITANVPNMPTTSNSAGISLHKSAGCFNGCVSQDHEIGVFANESDSVFSLLYMESNSTYLFAIRGGTLIVNGMTGTNNSNPAAKYYLLDTGNIIPDITFINCLDGDFGANWESSITCGIKWIGSHKYGGHALKKLNKNWVERVPKIKKIWISSEDGTADNLGSSPAYPTLLSSYDDTINDYSEVEEVVLLQDVSTWKTFGGKNVKKLQLSGNTITVNDNYMLRGSLVVSGAGTINNNSYAFLPLLNEPTTLIFENITFTGNNWSADLVDCRHGNFNNLTVCFNNCTFSTGASKVLAYCPAAYQALGFKVFVDKIEIQPNNDGFYITA